MWMLFNMTRKATSAWVGMCLLAGACAFAASPQDAQSAPASKSSTPPVSIFEERPINWKSLVPDVYHDQRTIWLFPAQLARGQHWVPTLGIAAIFGGLVALDPHDSPYFRTNSSTFSRFNRGLSGTHAAIGIAAVPASFYALGLVRKDSYTTHTSLLAGESVVDAAILTWVLKNATGRLRPSAIPTGGNYSDTWFKTYQPPLRADTSFPSAHSIAAFSVATVFARRYRESPLGALGGIWGRDFGGRLAHYPSGTFPLGRFRRRRLWLHYQPICGHAGARTGVLNSPGRTTGTCNPCGN